MIDIYRKHYAELQFERAGLFELVQQTFHSTQVLYPGCFVHITPSLYFPHVVYLDQSPEAQTFFADLENVSQYVDRNKRYRRSAYIRFIAQDFTDPLPLPQGSFDQLISLFTAGVASACQGYLKPGGLLLTNRHRETKTIDFELVSTVRYRSGRYRLIKGNQALQPVARSDPKQISRYLRQRTRGLQYSENETYFLYKKRRSQG